jgi:hypothetical protein
VTMGTRPPGRPSAAGAAAARPLGPGGLDARGAVGVGEAPPRAWNPGAGARADPGAAAC